MSFIYANKTSHEYSFTPPLLEQGVTWLWLVFQIIFIINPSMGLFKRNSQYPLSDWNKSIFEVFILFSKEFFFLPFSYLKKKIKVAKIQFLAILISQKAFLVHSSWNMRIKYIIDILKSISKNFKNSLETLGGRVNLISKLMCVCVLNLWHKEIWICYPVPPTQPTLLIFT